MAFCNNCGSKLTDGTRFCPECGAAVSAPEQPVYQAPVQPEQPVYQTPVQPKQPVYQAPVQPEQPVYQAPVQPSPAPQTTVAVKEKKPLNTKLLLIIGGAAVALIVVVVLLIVLLGGKGGNNASDDPNLGMYNATTAKMMGMDMDIADLYANGFTIELKKNGKFSMNVDGTKGSGKWTLEDGVFHVDGGGLDCDGTLANGVMILTNVMDMGVDITFEKEGGFQGGDVGGAGAAGSAGEGAPAVADTVIQKQWNGTWYGCLHVVEASGYYESLIPADDYDCYMVVDVDAEGKGQFAVFLDGVNEALAMGTCEATENGLNAVEGTVAGDTDMYAYNWMFLPMPDYPDQYTMGDFIEDGADSFSFTLFMKQWGGSWQDEIDSDFAIVPPSVQSYNAAIENGELPPIGFAPIDYDGSADPSAVTPGSTGESGGGMDDAEGVSTYDTSSFKGILDLEGKGLVELSYPEDQFTQDEYHTIKCHGIYFTTIYVYPQGSSSIAGSDENMSKLSGSVDFADSQVTLGGFPARRVTCIDDFFEEPFVYYLIDTSSANNPDVGGVYIKVNLYDTADYSLVDAIVNTIKVK